jgi:tetratricopeptide (TPR) repeat protein
LKHRIGFFVALAILFLLASAPRAAHADGGLDSFERAAELAPDDPQAQFNLGVMCLKAGDYSQAARALHKATALSPNDAEGWEAYGVALLHLRRLSDAQRALEQSTSLDPRRAGAWQKLGQALAGEGSPEDLSAAVDAYGKAARLKPDDPRSLLNQGLLLARLDRNLEAISVLRRVSRMEGGQGAFEALCVLYNKAGNYTEAEDVCRQAAEGGGRAESWYNLGFALQQSGDKAGARAAYGSAVQADPGHAPSLYALAFLDFEAGNADDALAGFQAALKARNGDYPEAAYNAAVLLGDQGRFEEAAALYREFLSTHPDDPDAQASLKAMIEAGLGTLLQQGQDAYERGDFDAAREAWKRARRLDPENGEAARMLRLAEAHGAARDAAKAARRAARSAVARRLKTEDAAMKRRGLAAFRDGRNADAARLLDFYLRHNPGDSLVEKDLVKARGRMRAAVDELLRQSEDSLAAGDRDRAGSLAAQALEQDPGNARARYLQHEAGLAPVKKLDLEAVRKLYYDGVEQYLAGDLQGAVATWTEVLKQDPDHLDAQRSLARAQLELQALKNIGKS